MLILVILTQKWRYYCYSFFLFKKLLLSWKGKFYLCLYWFTLFWSNILLPYMSDYVWSCSKSRSSKRSYRYSAIQTYFNFSTMIYMSIEDAVTLWRQSNGNIYVTLQFFEKDNFDENVFKSIEAIANRRKEMCKVFD